MARGKAVPATHGHCRAPMWMHVERGHFGTVKLDETRFGVMAAWPGATHQGNGTHQVIVDDRVTPEQRDALEAIGKGKETEPGKVVWFIYVAMSTTFLPTVTARIDLRMDAEAREAAVAVAGLLDGTVAPIRNAVTGAAHRARITLPMGVEYTEADAPPEPPNHAARSRSTSPVRTRISPVSTGARTASSDSRALAKRTLRRAPSRPIDAAPLWAVMMTGMMLPSAAPAVLLYAPWRDGCTPRPRPVARTRLPADTWWCGPRLPPRLLPPNACRSLRLSLRRIGAVGTIGALRMGIGHGVYCLGCCWALMLLLFVRGVMYLPTIVLLTVFVLLEKLLPGGRHAPVGVVDRTFSGCPT